MGRLEAKEVTMYDSFSEGHVFFGRAIALAAALVALAYLAQLL